MAIPLQSFGSKEIADSIFFLILKSPAIDAAKSWN
jgi:hypothetical protein